METYAVYRCLQHECNVSFMVEVFEEKDDELDASCCPACQGESLYYLGDCLLSILELGGE